MLLLLYGVHTSSADPNAAPDSDEVASMRRRILAFADQIFDQADTNNDNVLSRDEFAKAVGGDAVVLCLRTCEHLFHAVQTNGEHCGGRWSNIRTSLPSCPSGRSASPRTRRRSIRSHDGAGERLLV